MAFLSLSSLFYLFSKKEKLKKQQQRNMKKKVEFDPPSFARNGFPYVCTNVFARPNQLNQSLYEHCYRFFWLKKFVVGHR